MRNFIIITLFSLGSLYSSGQGFIASLNDRDIGAIGGKNCILTMDDGSELTGKFSGAVVINGYLSRVTIKDENGEKMKLKPESIQRLQIEAGTLAKLSMMAESASSISEAVKTDFSEIVNREYIIFETAMRHNKKAKLRLMQLLNPGFDNVIKVYVDPNAKQTGGMGVGGLQLSGGEDKSYLFVINDEQAVKVKKGSYKRNFEELYSSCPTMVELFEGERLKWKDVAGHVFAYDQLCNIN